MKTFIFYSLEGYTESPTHDEVENCQLLGEASGRTAKEALDHLVEKNGWIKECGFRLNEGQIIARELANTERIYL